METANNKNMKTFKIYFEESIMIRVLLEDPFDKYVAVRNARAIKVDDSTNTGKMIAKHLQKALSGFVEGVGTGVGGRIIFILKEDFKPLLTNGVLSIVRKPTVEMKPLKK